ncbi:MAG TPA: GspH/FimT family pseudopilin [Nitrospiria bacterium]|nr:GspH/FimT family pseudopilin [Nitrospiria bacterium]
MDTIKEKALSNQKGFTLVELMVTVSIVIILAAVGVGTFFNSLPRYRLNAAARDLVSNMRMARQTAATQNTPYSIQFLTTTTYSILGKVVSAPNDVSWAMPAVPVLSFQPNGLISGGPVVLTMNDSHGDIKTVNISATGRIHIQ